MTAPRFNVSEILRCLHGCLRHSYESLRPALASLGQLSTWPVVMLFQTDRDNSTMGVSSSIWRGRLVGIAKASIGFLWVAVIYLASELIIWGLSRALAPVNLSFFSSIFGMALTFTAMAIASIWVQNIGDIYKDHIKTKVRGFRGLDKLPSVDSGADRFHQRPSRLGLPHPTGYAQPKRHPECP